MDVYATPIMADIDTAMLQLDELSSQYPQTVNGRRLRTLSEALAEKWERHRNDVLCERRTLAIHGIDVLRIDATPAR